MGGEWISDYKSNIRPCLINGFIDLTLTGKLKQAIHSLQLLSRQGIRLNCTTLAFLLQQCGNYKSLRQGKWVHLHLKLTGLKHPNTYLSNHLIIMYFKCGSDIEARKVFDTMSMRNLYSWNNMLSGYAKLGMLKPAKKLFDKMPERDVVSWNTMVIAFAKNGMHRDALRFYVQMRRLSVGFNQFSFAGVLITCVKLEDFGFTRQVHCQILVAGFLSNLVLSSSLVDAYAKCKMIDDARKLFNDMDDRDVLAWTTLVSGYAKCGDLESARELFNQMPEPNPVSWTVLIGAYARNGQGQEALKLFQEMTSRNLRPDQFTFSSSLCASASIASLKHGKQIHARLIRMGFVPNTIVVSSLIDMYSKCGCVEIAKRVFDLMGEKRDVVLWNTMISVLAQHGLGAEAISMFSEMVRAGAKPDRITLVVVLSACSHSGLVDEGVRLFEVMTREHSIVADQEHYACLIDLLGRAGQFEKVMFHLEKMPCKPDGRVWNAVLGACRLHGNVELGRKAAEQLIELEPEESAAYVLLSNIYAAGGRWESVEKVRHLMNKRQVKKERALSWLEVERKVHTFTVADQSHPSKDEVFLVLEQLSAQIEDELNCR